MLVCVNKPLDAANVGTQAGSDQTTGEKSHKPNKLAWDLQ